MKVERVEPKKKKSPSTNWFGRLFVIGSLVVAGFAVWKVKTGPLPGVMETQPAIANPVQRSLPYKPGIPIPIDASGQFYAIPLLQGTYTTNLLIYHYAQQDRRLLFNEPVIMTSIQKSSLNNAPGLAITIVKDDTNSNGTLDQDDIRELVWYNAETGTLSRISRPLLSFIRLIPTPQADHLLFEVRVDLNRNGRSERTDPKQFVIVQLPDTIYEILPESVVPTLSIPSRNIVR